MTGRIALACIIAAAIVPTHAQAQSAKKKSRTTLHAELLLTDSQIAREKALHYRYVPLIRAARGASRDSAARVRAQELQEFRTILTPSQQQKLDAVTNREPKPRRGAVPRLMPARIAVPR